MPAIQTSYAATMPPAQAGLVANMETQNSITRLIEDAAGVGFGIALFQGAADLGVTKTPGTLFKGVSIANKTLVMAAAGGTVDVYPQRYNVALLDKGVIWVNVAAAVAAGAPAYVTSAGVWTSTATGNTAIPNATFDSSTTGAGLAKLRLR